MHSKVAHVLNALFKKFNVAHDNNNDSKNQNNSIIQIWWKIKKMCGLILTIFNQIVLKHCILESKTKMEINQMVR